MIAALFAPLAAVVMPVLGAIASAIAFVVKSFFEGLTVIFSKPVTFVTVGVMALACYGLGINRGLIIDGYLVRAAKQETSEWKGAHAKLLSDAENANAANKAKFKAALKAKADAEAAEKAKGPLSLLVPAAPAAEPKRVQPARKTANRQDPGPGKSMCGVFPLLGGCP